MGIFKRLHYHKQNGELGQCDMYDNTEECPLPRVCVTVGEKNGYVKLGEINDPQATPLRCYVAKYGRDYAVLKSSEMRFPPLVGNIDQPEQLHSWTCPAGVTRIEVDGNRNIPYAVDVVPGREYKFQVSYGDAWSMRYYTGKTWEEKIGKKTYTRYEHEYIGDNYKNARYFIRTSGDLIIRYNVTTTKEAKWMLYSQNSEMG
jgi:hypothetical protein|nr:MAG TPA: hypothetical protein [Caudoviricetes sp.]